MVVARLRNLATATLLSFIAAGSWPSPEACARPARAAQSEGSASSKSVTDADPAARRLCGALHRLPEARRAGCCGTPQSSTLADECARALSASLREKSLTVDPVSLARCEADSARDHEGCDWVKPYQSPAPESCRAALRGRFEAGARCRSSLECEDGLACRGSSATGGGICLPPGRNGSICGAAPDPLAAIVKQGDFEQRHPECEGLCSSGRCTSRVRDGGPCTTDSQCAASSHCQAARCQAGPKPKLGESCVDAACDDGLICTQGKCSPPKKAGESCKSSSECQAACLLPTGAEVGTCGMKCSAWPPAGYAASR